MPDRSSKIRTGNFAAHAEISLSRRRLKSRLDAISIPLRKCAHRRCRA